MLLRAIAVACLLFTAAFPGFAQQNVQVQLQTGSNDQGRVQVTSPILVVDGERLFSESLLGQQIRADIEEAGAALQAKNNEIASQLEAEEQELTLKRPEMTPEDFRVLADEFDDKAERIRAERAAELRALNQRLEEVRRNFLQQALPILESIMREAGAAVVLEQRDVFISSVAVDITDIAIARVDAATRQDAAEQE